MLIKKQTLDIAITLLVVLASGNPVVYYWFGKEVVLIGLPVLLFCYGFVRGLKLNKADILIFVAFVLIGLVHFIEFGASVMPATLGFLLKIVTALLLVRTVKDFPDAYARLMFGLAILSLVFFASQVLLGDTLRSHAQKVAIPYAPEVIHIGLHNFGLEIHAYRNSGFFWEPGAFAGYLMVAVIFLVMQKLGRGEDLKFDTTLSILTLALLSTQSTTAYVGLTIFIFIFLYMKYGIRYVGRLMGAGILFIVAAYSAYVELAFLADKIDAQYEEVVSQDERYELGRFGNAVYDLDSIKNRPLLGWSPYVETRTAVDYAVSDVIVGQGNGLTGLMVRFGLVGFLIYALFAYRFFLSHSRHVAYALSATIILLVLLIGEQYLNYPLFLTMMFAGSKAVARMHKSRGHRIYMPWHMQNDRGIKAD